ncbi:MAG: hypothetical protein HFG00_06340 [Oscillibacter sp.]|nr:hypothetical protein [Oscillibacter sp.]
MKITKTEKIWLALTVLFYVLYNLPGVPPYGQAVPTIVHGLLTVLPLWVIVYIGLARVYKIYTLRDDNGTEG